MNINAKNINKFRNHYEYETNINKDVFCRFGMKTNTSQSYYSGIKRGSRKVERQVIRTEGIFKLKD